MECTCKRCKTKFEPFTEENDCRMCDDGYYESDAMLYDDTTETVSCPFCGGRGFHEQRQETYCRHCSAWLEEDDD